MSASMKKLFLITNFMVSLSLLGIAQTDRGAKLIGGTGTLHIGTVKNN